MWYIKILHNFEGKTGLVLSRNKGFSSNDNLGSGGQIFFLHVSYAIVSLFLVHFPTQHLYFYINSPKFLIMMICIITGQRQLKGHGSQLTPICVTCKTINVYTILGVRLKEDFYIQGCSVNILSWVKIFRIIPDFRIKRLTFHRKSA